MRKSSLLLVLLTTLISFGQDKQIPINDKSGLAEYTEVISEGGSAQVLYDQTKAWINTYYKNPTGVIKTDVAGEEITGKSRFKVYQRDKKGNVIAQTYVNYNFSISFKDGKYKYVIDHINWQRPSYFDITRWEDPEANGYQKNVYPLYVTQAVAFFEKHINDMQDGIATPLETEAGDW